MRSVTQRSFVFIFGLFSLLLLAAGCGGGGGSSTSAVPGALPPQQQPVGSLDSASRTVPLSETNTPIALPSVAGIGSSITLSPNDAPPGATISIFPSTGLPSFVAGPLPPNSVLFESFTLLASQEVTFSSKPKIGITLPAAPANQGANFAWIYDTTDGWHTYANVAVSGNRLTIGGFGSALQFKKGVAYVIAVLAAPATAGCPTPAPRPSATFLPSPIVSPHPITAAFVLSFTPRTSIGFVSAFKNGNYNTPVYQIPISSPSILHTLPNGTLFVLSRGNCNVLSYAPGSTTSQSISVPGCPENFDLDRSGNLYAITNNGGNIVELAANNYSTVLRTLTPKSGFKFHPFPAIITNESALTSDASGNVFAVEYADADLITALVEEFAPTGNASIRTIPLSNYPRQVVVDSTGEVYAGAPIFESAILGYPPNSSTANVIIPTFDNPQISLDSADHLYQIHFGVPALINEYAPRTSTVIAQSSLAEANPTVAFAVDPADNIWARDDVQFPVVIYPSLTNIPTGATIGATLNLGQWSMLAGGFAFVK